MGSVYSTVFCGDPLALLPRGLGDWSTVHFYTYADESVRVYRYEPPPAAVDGFKKRGSTRIHAALGRGDKVVVATKRFVHRNNYRLTTRIVVRIDTTEERAAFGHHTKLGDPWTPEEDSVAYATTTLL